MPENHDFEKAMQQRLDGFQVTPSPSDWQAVYQQLHPNKKRRPIWWWMPALLTMLALGWYISKEPNGTGQAIVTNPANKLLPPSSPNHNTSLQQEKSTTPVTTKDLTKSLGHESGNEIAAELKAERIHADVDVANSRPVVTSNSNGLNKKQTFTTQRKESSSVIGRKTVTTEKATSNQKAAIVLQSGKSSAFILAPGATKTSDVPDVPLYNMALLQQTAVNNSVPEAAHLHGPIPNTLKQNNEAQTNAVIEKTNPAPWHWGVYAGIGVNLITEPISMLKSQADNLSSAPGSSRLVSTSTEQDGWHYNVGFFVNRKWNRNWQFNAGLGVNASTWNTSTTTYIDSILPAGNLYSRGLVSTVQKSNTLWMAELPIQISNRIAGKAAGTFWWTAGINNQFLLKLKEETITRSVLINFSTTSDEKSLTAGVNKYQPQLRVGLMYDHAGKKSHWQLATLMNIGLVKPLQSGDFNLMNVQLQGRWFFSRQP